MKVALFCVAYNSPNELVNFLKSCVYSFESVSSPSIYVDIHVIDNSSVDNEFNFYYHSDRFCVTYFKSLNLGYLPSVNSYVINSGIDLTSFDYTVCCNVDLTLSPDFFLNLLDLSLTSNVGCIAPSIFNSDNINLNPKLISRPSRLKLEFNRFFYYFSSLKHILFSFYYFRISKRSVSQSIPLKPFIYAPHGSFFIFTSVAFSRGFKFDYPIFLYGEELFVGERMRDLGLFVSFFPVLKIFDLGGVSTSNLSSKVHSYYNIKALNYILENFYNGRSQDSSATVGKV